MVTHNTLPVPIVQDGVTIPPGSSADLPGLYSYAIITPAGVEYFGYSPGASFGAGFLVGVPLLSVVLIRFALRLFRHVTLDRWTT
jgi:hypothetical protein